MKKHLLFTTLTVIISLCTTAVFSYRKEITRIKSHLTNKTSLNNLIISNPLTDKILKNPSELIYGLDFSHHQQNINWDEVHIQLPYFIIFKTKEVSTHKDTKYASYYKEEKSRGILVGGYHFFSYQSSGSDQAKHFLKNLNLAKGDILGDKPDYIKNFLRKN
jgi:GH25 family lysozyme M1 (1,4-beta-N-acetylmuramidase)